MTKKFDQIFNLMENSFPENEYRTYENQKKLLQNPYYKLITRENEKGEILAFLAWWDTEKFSFIEHLAVSPLCRGKGTGTNIMKEFINNTQKTIILEIEIPCDNITVKRLRFYEKLGFKLNKYEYYQLPLRANEKPVPMNLMSYPQPLNKSDFEKIKKYLYMHIYGESENNISV